MRIPSGVTDQVIYFVAEDSEGSRMISLSDFTVYRSRNTTTATAMTTPTVTEVDATNMKGVYTLLLDEDMTIGAGNDSEEMVFHITATGMTSVTRSIELYRRTVTAGETLTVSSGIGTANTTQIEGSDATDQIRDAVVDDATRIDASALNTASAAVGSDGTGLTEAGGTGDHLTAIITDLDDIKGTGFAKDTHSLTNIEGYADLIDDGTSGLAKIATDVAEALVDTNSLNDTKIPDTLSLANINAEVDTAWTTQMADSTVADGTIPTREQAMLFLTRFLTEFGISGTTLTVNKEDGTTAVATFTLDDATSPTSLTRAT